MSKQQMPLTKSFTLSNTSGLEELCALHAANSSKHIPMRGWESSLRRDAEKTKGPSGTFGRAFESAKRLSGDRGSWNLHRRVGFRRFHHHRVSHRRRYCHGCHLLHRYCHGCCRHHLHRYSRGWVRNRSETELDSCGSVRNKFAALNKSLKEEDCKNAAANCRDCCYKPAYSVESAVAARRNVRHWKKLADCCCNSA